VFCVPTIQETTAKNFEVIELIHKKLNVKGSSRKNQISLNEAKSKWKTCKKIKELGLKRPDLLYRRVNKTWKLTVGVVVEMNMHREKRAMHREKRAMHREKCAMHREKCAMHKEYSVAD